MSDLFELTLMVVVYCLLVVLVVMIHYEFLNKLFSYLPRLDINHRRRIAVGVCGALLAHTIEVWVFAIAYYFINKSEGWGYLEGNFDGSLLDCGYFSFTTFTTLGFGDIQPFGDIRYLTGIESLTGLVLITWTASFLYLEMQRYWSNEE